MTEIRIGQLWADRDHREFREDKRQRLRVVGIYNETRQVQRSRMEKAFRLIQEPSP